MKPYIILLFAGLPFPTSLPEGWTCLCQRTTRFSSTSPKSRWWRSTALPPKCGNSRAVICVSLPGTRSCREDTEMRSVASHNSFAVFRNLPSCPDQKPLAWPELAAGRSRRERHHADKCFRHQGLIQVNIENSRTPCFLSSSYYFVLGQVWDSYRGALHPFQEHPPQINLQHIFY